MANDSREFSLTEKIKVEDELLLLCLRSRLGQDHTERIHELLAINLDRSYLTARAVRHNLFALFYTGLPQTCRNGIADALYTEIKTKFFHIVAAGQRSTAFLLKILALFQENDICAVPYKGPALSEFVYGDFYYRRYCDLDILVDRCDAVAACILLEEIGFQRELELTDSQMLKYVRHEQDIALISEDMKLAVELHWEISRYYSRRELTLPYYADRLVRVELFNEQVLSLSVEDLFIFLCLHGTKHGWSQLEWSFCIAELLYNTPAMNWPMVLKLADDLHCRRRVFLALALVHQLYGVNFSDEITEVVFAEKQINDLARQVQVELLMQEEQDISSLQGRYSRFQLSVRDSWYDQFLYLVRLVFRPTKKEWHMVTLPASCAFLYFPLRIFFLIYETIVKLQGPSKNSCPS